MGAAPLLCPFDGRELDAHDRCPRCGAGLLDDAELRAQAPTIHAALAKDERPRAGGAPVPDCPACLGPMTLYRVGRLEVRLDRCPSCHGWLLARPVADGLARLELQVRRQAAWESFPEDERRQMAREMAAATTTEPKLGPFHATLTWLGLPVVSRTGASRTPVATFGLAGAMLLLFVWQMAGPGLGPSIALMSYDPAAPGPGSALTATFGHAGWLHLAGNLYFLIAFGDGVEQRLPRGALLLGFVVTGALSIVIQGVVDPNSAVIGASGGISAIIGACAILQPRQRVSTRVGPILLRVPLAAYAAFALAADLFIASRGSSGVAWVAHVAGLAMGAVAALAFRAFSRARRG